LSAAVEQVGRIERMKVRGRKIEEDRSPRRRVVVVETEKSKWQRGSHGRTGMQLG
jgi:hypothetical protein